MILTHGHPDHIGTAERARREAAATIMAHSPEVEFVRGRAKGSSPFTLVPALIPKLRHGAAASFVMEATVQGFLTPKWVEEVTAIEARQQLDVPGRPRVVATPGHTAGHASFHFADRGVVVAGDALVTRDPITGATGPRLPSDAVNADPQAARGSLDAIAALDAATLLPGHGEPWQGR